MSSRPPRHAPATPASAPGNGRYAGRSPARLAAVVVATAGLLGAGLLVTSSGDGEPAGCRPTGTPLHLVVSPELVAPVQRAAGDASRGPGGCVAVQVQAREAAQVLDGLAGGGRRPDVWVPDSSTWLGRPAARRAGLPALGPSVVRSPLLFAVPSELAGRVAAPDRPLDLSRLLLAGPPAGLRLGLPAPRRSAATVGAVLAVQAALGDQPDARPRVTDAIRSAPAGLPERPARLLNRLRGEPGLAVPVTEQALASYARSPDAVALTAVPLPADALDLDYPYLVLTGDARREEQAHRLLAALRSRDGQRLLMAEGFRGADGQPGTGRAVGAADLPPSAPRVPDAAAVQAAVHLVEAIRSPARVLAVLDVSGSMRAPVPGTSGLTRLQVSTRAAGGGLALYPDDTEIGLWVFSTHLSPGKDFRELVPVQRLSARTDGRTTRQRLAAALSAVRPVPSGGTGLYDTVLAAVRTLTHSWSPGRVHSVVLLSDGKDDDPGGVGLPGLQETLAREHDPERPVRVVTIAFGPDSDASSLAAISRATGGVSYVAHRPADIRRVFLDAVGQRSCRPSC